MVEAVPNNRVLQERSVQRLLFVFFRVWLFVSRLIEFRVRAAIAAVRSDREVAG